MATATQAKPTAVAAAKPKEAPPPVTAVKPTTASKDPAKDAVAKDAKDSSQGSASDSRRASTDKAVPLKRESSNIFKSFAKSKPKAVKPEEAAEGKLVLQILHE